MTGISKACEAKHFLTRTPEERRQAVAAAVRALKAGNLIVVPTDTVYGLACLPEADPIQKVYLAKGRQEKNPLVLLLSDAKFAERFARIPIRARELIAKYWPGALTLVLPVRPGTDWGRLTRGGRYLGLRVPDQPLLRRIISRAGGVLAVTSANPSGSPAPSLPAQVAKKILAFSSVLVDAEVIQSGTPSTIAKLSSREIKILRQGSIKL